MSLTYTQITTKIIRNCHSNEVSYPASQMNVDINLAVDKVFSTIFRVGGMWQFDDSGHIDYPTIKTNLADGQRDYPFTTDEQGNLILDIYKVFVKDQSGIYHEIPTVDVASNSNTAGFTDGQDTEGVPDRYDKLANGIFLDPIPSYNSTEGLKILISREGSYFTTSDTTKKPGFAGIYHEYLLLRPSYDFARLNSLANAETLKRDMLEMEKDIEEYYSFRDRDAKNMITMSGIRFR